MGTANPKRVRNRLHDYASRPVEPVTRGSKGSVVDAFDRVLATSDAGQWKGSERRYWVWGFCFCDPGEELKPLRSGDLTDGQWFALKQWVGSKKQGDVWTVRASFANEARWVLALASTINFLQVAEPGRYTFSEWLDGLEEKGEMDQEWIPVDEVQKDAPELVVSTDYQQIPEDEPQVIRPDFEYVPL